MRLSFSRFKILFLAGSTFVHSSFASVGAPFSAILQQRAEGARQIDLGTAYQNLAVLAVLRGHPRKALTTIDQAIATWNQVLPPDHPFIVYALSTKMTVYTKLKGFERGEELVPKVLTLSESRLGGDHPERVILLNNAAALYVAEKQYAKAEPLLREAVAAGKRRFKAGHPTMRIALLDYSYVLAQLNRKDEAARAKAESGVIQADLPTNALFSPARKAVQ